MKEGRAILPFRKLTLADLPACRPYLASAPGRACDSTVGGVFLWRRLLSAEFAFAGGALLLKVKVPQTLFYPPLGGDADAALDALERHCSETGEPFAFYAAADNDTLAPLRARRAFSEMKNRDLFDYLYEAKALQAFAGRKYHGQRNHVNAFYREAPGCEFRILSGGDAQAVRHFLARVCPLQPSDPAVLYEERESIFEVMDNYDHYGFTGGALVDHGEMVAFSLGETRGDTLFVHIEKANTGYRGAYPAMVSAFARAFADIDYINREDDYGDEGLRVSKLSYHPVAMLEKIMLT